jgi:uncharacterized glyoxalase superfamily protein PhnB
MALEVHYWTTNVGRAIDYYTELLGFHLDFRHPGEGEPTFGILSLEGSTVMFAKFGAPPHSGDASRADAQLCRIIADRARSAGAIAVYVQVADVGAHFGRVRDTAATVIETLWDTPWGLKQFSVLDPDGNILTIHG